MSVRVLPAPTKTVTTAATPQKPPTNPSPALVKGPSAGAVLIYGVSGAGKTTHLAEAAKWLVGQYGKPVRVITAEASTTIVFHPLRVNGLADVVLIDSGKPTVVADLRRLAAGEWPTENGWKKWDDGACAYIIEGMQSIGEVMINVCRAHGWFEAEQKETAVHVGDETLGLASRSMYNFVQNEILSLVTKFASIPNLQKVLWSAHETRGIEEDTAAQIRGPAIVGVAKTASVQKYFNMVLHIDLFTEVVGHGMDSVAETKYRVWLGQHADPKFKHILYPAKVVLPASAIPFFKERFPKSYFDAEIVVEQDSVRLKPSLADVLAAEQYALEAAASKLKS